VEEIMDMDIIPIPTIMDAMKITPKDMDTVANLVQHIGMTTRTIDMAIEAGKEGETTTMIITETIENMHQR
jgi:hypothetical protein